MITSPFSKSSPSIGKTYTQRVFLLAFVVATIASCSTNKRAEDGTVTINEIQRFICGDHGRLKMTTIQEDPTLVCVNDKDVLDGFCFGRDQNPDGYSYAVGRYKDGKLSGSLIDFNQKGMIQYVDEVEGEIHSRYHLGLRDNSFSHVIKRYRKGKKNGHCLAWSEYGRIAVSIYKNNQKEGWSVDSYENGFPKEWGRFQAGKKVGHWLEFYEQGKWTATGENEYKGPAPCEEELFSSRQGEYKNGLRHGQWREFLHDGRMVKHLFENGKRLK